MADFDVEDKEDSLHGEFPRIAPPFGGLIIAVERCPLCERTKKPFMCQKCVEKGDFVHSNNSGNGRNPERFSDKLLRLHQLRKERQDIFEKVSVRLERIASIAAKKWEISMLKDSLQLMQKALEECKDRLVADEKFQTSQCTETKEKLARAKIQAHKLERIKRYIEQSRGMLTVRQAELEGREKKLAELRRSNVDQLTTYIFTVNEIHTGDSKPADSQDEREGNENVVAALADARRMAYVQGRWIETENSQEVQYSMVHPSAVCLPANGDYTAYTNWVAANQDVLQGAESQLDLCNPGKVISGALCHTAQLVSLLTYYLGIVLPKKSHFSVFCGEELSSYEFYKAVDKLNTNVLYLCFSQNVHPDSLHPHYTVRNLLMLINPNNKHLGRNGPVDVHPDLLLSVPQTFRSSRLSESESASETPSHHMEEDSDTSGDLEWENVLESQVLALAANPSSATSPLPESVASFQQEGPGVDDSQLPATIPEGSASSSGGLMSSAAASVVSLWRAATSHR